MKAISEPEGLDMDSEEEDTLDKLLTGNPDYQVFLKFVLTKLSRLRFRR